MIVHAENLEIYVKQELERRYPDCSVDFIKVQKNNGLTLRGVTITAPGKNISPTIYIDEYLARGYSAKQICDAVSGIYEHNKDRRTLETDLTDFQAVCGRICFELVNAKMNDEWLKTVPHRRLHDLAIIYYILLDDQSDGLATVKINHQLASCWGVDEERLYVHAEENTRKLLHIIVAPMDMLLFSLQMDAEPQNRKVINTEDFTMTVRKAGELNMYVMSNKDKTFGAAAIIYTDILRLISEQLKTGFFILPSSVHEVILMPESENTDREELFEMVCAVNKTDVDPEIFLADNVYYYDYEKDTVTSLYDWED